MGQPGHGAVVDDTEPTVGHDPVVARVRIGVQQAGARRAGEQEPHVRLAVLVALLLRAVGDDLGQRVVALQPGGDEQPARCGRRRVGTTISGSSANSSAKIDCDSGLQAVVELLDDALLQLLDDALDVDRGRDDAEQPREPGHLAQVRAQGLGRTGVLDLDGDLGAVGPRRAVHLADRRGGRRNVVERRQLLAPRGPELGLEHAVHHAGRHRGSGVLELGEGLPVRAGDLVGQRRLEDAHRLPELHRAALELAEHAEDLVGGAALHLEQDGFGRRSAEPPAHAQRRAAGESHRQRRELHTTRKSAAGQRLAGAGLVLGHVSQDSRRRLLRRPEAGHRRTRGGTRPAR